MAKKPRESQEPAKLTIVPSASDILAGPPPGETTLERVWRENRVTPQKLSLQPKYEHVWKQLGGLELAIEYLRGSDDPDALKFLSAFDRVPFEVRDFMGFDGFCVAADVSGRKIFGMIAAEAVASSEQEMAIVTAIKAPAAIDTILDLAKDQNPAYRNERRLVAQATGWLPRPKSAQTNIQINTANVGKGGMPTITLPSVDQEIRELGERFQTLPVNQPKLLEADIIDAEED